MDDRIIDVQAKPTGSAVSTPRQAPPPGQQGGAPAGLSAYDGLAQKIPQLHALLQVSMSPDFAWSDEIRTHLLELAAELSNQVNECFKDDLAQRSRAAGG